MPYLKIQTNLPLGKKSEHSILRSASALIANRTAIGGWEEFDLIND